MKMGEVVEELESILSRLKVLRRRNKHAAYFVCSIKGVEALIVGIIRATQILMKSL